MPVDWSPLVAMIQEHQRFLLMTHIRPDADGMGSQLALAEALRGLGKQVRVAVASTIPPRYDFLNPANAVIERFRLPGKEFVNQDVIIILDTGTWNQLGDFADFLKSQPITRVVIDHHQTQDDLGGLTFVDTTAEATGRLTYELIQALRVAITPTIANALLMALATDTGWFRHANTTAASFSLASELVRHGAEPTRLYEQLYESAPLSRLRLTGKALDRLQLHAAGQIAYTEVFLKDYDETGAVPGDTEELINYTRSIAGVEVGLIFIEQPEGGTKISFRARSRVDVSKLAQQFGGGGHRLAAGARTNMPLAATREAVLRAVEAVLQRSESV